MIPIILQISNKYESISGRSTRLINGMPSFVNLLKRIIDSGYKSIVISTTSDSIDDSIETMAADLGIEVVRGEYHDVLGRLAEAANVLNRDYFVRILGNNPLVDLEMMEELAASHVNGNYDYSYNEHKNGVILGMGCEVFSTNIVKKLNRELFDVFQRETVGFYIQQNEEKYNINRFSCLNRRPEYRLNLETEKDLKLLQEIFNNVEEINCTSIISFLESHKILEDYNIENSAKEVGIEKLFLHPEKIQDILENREKANTYPISVELTLTNACNLKCIYCSDQELRDRQGIKNLEFGVFQNLFRDLKKGGTKGVVFEGGGEPTIHPDFERLVDSAWNEGLAVGLITNGTQGISKDTLKKFEWIRVSLDASNADEYLELKKVDLFEKVISNIANYAEGCKTVGVGYVVTNKNMSNIETLVLRLRSLKVSYIQLRPVVDSPELSPSEKSLNYLELYRNDRFNVIVDGMKENADSGNEELPCYSSSITSVISGDGSVFLCGRLNIYEWLKPIGNIKYQTFKEIWLGEERKNQLEMVGKKDFCKSNCPQCRITKYNVLFNRLLNTKSLHFI